MSGAAPQRDRKGWNRRAGCLLAVVALLSASFLLRARLREVRASAPDPSRALARVLSAEEQIAAGLLGGFRAFLINLLWVRVQWNMEQGKYLELPFLYDALRELQGTSPALFRVQGSSMVLDIPRLLVDQPEERWRWIATGFDLLRRGRERFPEDVRLLSETGLLYYIRFHPFRQKWDREHFLADRAANPAAEDPLELSRRFLREALRLPGHSLKVDLTLWAVLGLRMTSLLGDSSPPALPAERLPEARSIVSQGRELLDHLRKEHQAEQKAADLIERLREQLEEAEAMLSTRK